MEEERVRRCLITGINSLVSHAQFHNILSNIGSVEKSEIARSRMTGASLGVGYVVFSEPYSSTALISAQKSRYNGRLDLLGNVNAQLDEKGAKYDTAVHNAENETRQEIPRVLTPPLTGKHTSDPAYHKNRPSLSDSRAYTQSMRPPPRPQTVAPYTTKFSDRRTTESVTSDVPLNPIELRELNKQQNISWFQKYIESQMYVFFKLPTRQFSPSDFTDLIKRTRIKYRMICGNLSGYFIIFDSYADARRCCNEFDGKRILGRVMELSVKKDRQVYVPQPSNELKEAILQSLVSSATAGAWEGFMAASMKSVIDEIINEEQNKATPRLLGRFGGMPKLKKRKIESKPENSSTEPNEKEKEKDKFIAETSNTNEDEDVSMKDDTNTNAEDDSIMDTIKTEDIKTEDIKTEDIKTEDIKTEDIKTEDIKTEDIKTEVTPMDDDESKVGKIEEVAVEEMKSDSQEPESEEFSDGNNILSTPVDSEVLFDVPVAEKTPVPSLFSFGDILSFVGGEKDQELLKAALFQKFPNLAGDVIRVKAENTIWPPPNRVSHLVSNYCKLTFEERKKYLQQQRPNGPLEVVESYSGMPLRQREVKYRARNLRSIAKSMGLRSTRATHLFTENYLTRAAKKVRLARSAIHAWGLYASEVIKTGEYVIEYTGERISEEYSEWREKSYSMGGMDSTYLFTLEDGSVLDATHKGNLARFMNHSCDPNCEAHFLYYTDKTTRITFYARRDIEIDEELTFSYNFNEDGDTRERVTCLCGAANCKGWIM